jgi:ABC-type branched-subunit amino acid transport system substrate-binding protein
MTYYDIKGLTFLGTSAWNGPGLISIGGKGAEGSILVDAFFKKDSSPSVARFVEEFRKTYQHDPETLEALSYDGAKLIKEILPNKIVKEFRWQIRRIPKNLRRDGKMASAAASRIPQSNNKKDETKAKRTRTEKNHFIKDFLLKKDFSSISESSMKPSR